MIKKQSFWTNFILYGKFGCGKTTCSCTAPKPIALLDCDNKAHNQTNIKSLVQSSEVDIYSFNYALVAGDELDYVMKPDTPNKVPDGYKSFVNLINKIVKEEPKEYASIVIDSGSRIVQHLIQLITAVNGKTQMNQNLWNVFATEMSNRLTRLMSIPVNFIWTFHERVNIDEVTKQQTVCCSIPGQTGDDIGSYFNEVYNCKVDEIAGKHYYYLVTRSNAKYNNRTSGYLDLKEEPNLTKIISKLEGTFVPTPKPEIKNGVKSNVVTASSKK